MKKSISDKIFDAVVVMVIVFSIIICVMPLLHIVSISVSSKIEILSGRVGLLPRGFNLESYVAVFRNGTVVYSLIYTIFITAIYTVLSMLMTICAAYPLTKEGLKGKNFFLILIIITMYFSGGIIPDYILMKKLSLTNNLWVLILPGLISAYNMIILKTFFASIPESLEESAHIDGCSHIGILFRIVLPLSTPVLATLSLFYAVGRWNGFQDALMYITKPELYPIQLKLYQITTSISSSDIMREGSSQEVMVAESIKAASIVIGTLPIVALYPKLQKYFISGVMIGAVKG